MRAWKIDTQKHTASHCGITFRFSRHGGGWICESMTPGMLKSYIGDGKDMGTRLMEISDDALKTWKAVIASGHSRKNCPHMIRKHPWSQCPKNTTKGDL